MNNIQEFETRLESIRSALYIPGMSAALAKGGQVVWAKDFGYADVENQRQKASDYYHRRSRRKLAKPY